VIVTRGKSLRRRLENSVKQIRSRSACRADSVEQVAGERQICKATKPALLTNMKEGSVDEIVRALTACNGRVGGADGAAARLGMNRTTFLSRMKKFGIYAKQYA